MFPGTDHGELRRIALRQLGVVHRDQFRVLDVSRNYVASQISARRWTAVGQNVVLLQNAPPLRMQLMWLAVLDAGDDVALGSHTSLELAGFKGFSRECDEIHLIVQRGARATPLPGVHIHESRRLRADDIVHAQGLPRTETARSVLDAAAWQPWPRVRMSHGRCSRPTAPDDGRKARRRDAQSRSHSSQGVSTVGDRRCCYGCGVTRRD
jgi:hypothetical protein